MKDHPFDYDLHFSVYKGGPRSLVCFHGYGEDYRIAEKIRGSLGLDMTLVSFNFPDYDITQRGPKSHAFVYGSIAELLPALYVLKKWVIDLQHSSVDLFGHSAGAGAVINLIAILNSHAYDAELDGIGIGRKEKFQLIAAIKCGIVLLDVPLKSIEEIIDLRGSSEELESIAKSYSDNQMRPIDTLNAIEGLALTIILFFQTPDEVISNRDDTLFIERLTAANSQGETLIIRGDEGGHEALHPSLWTAYQLKR